ncbi:MAG: hypothetical protein E7361_03805 [Clostridiales bacterium]|nr:hypothetical protein [Clostridiales bacterium]
MKSKKVAILITLNIVFALAIIGLAVGLVLVAQKASINNQMSIRYDAKNVDVEIVASGKKYANKNDTTGEAIKLADSEETSRTIQFTAEQGSDETNTNISFETVTIDDATGKAVYTFRIKNTASINNTNELKALATFSGLTEDDNVSVFVGPSSEAYADTEITSDTDDYFINIGAGQSSRSIVVVLKITDATESVQDFVLNMDLELSYDIKFESTFDWSGAITTDDLDVIWGIKNNSTSAFDITIDGTIDNLSTSLANNGEYVGSHYIEDVSSCAINFNAETTNRTDTFIFKVTYLTLDNSIICRDIGIFDASAKIDDYYADGYGKFISTYGDTNNLPISSVVKGGFMWGYSGNNLGATFGWYDTDIKIFVEITDAE